jgi:hypothetical protein
MSLAVLADHLASKGRNGDTMLVHMTPDEVRGLHALALAHGGKLTINPETGLPEANFLKKLLPMIAGMALNFIAPGVGTAIGSLLPSALGLSAATAGAIGTGIAVGGITGLATGSLKQGIMAGLGAYGGASLAGGLSAAGAAGAEQAALQSITPEQIAQYKELGIPQSTLIEDVTRNAGVDFAKKGALDRFTGGLGALTDPAGRSAFMTGVGGTSGLMKAGYGAMMGADVLGQPKTTTPQGSYTYTPRIRPMAMGEGQTLEQLPMFSATGTDSSSGMNTGGIVALAAGGASDPTQQGAPTAAQLAAQKSIENDPQAAALAAARSGVAKGLTDQQIADMVNQQYGKTFSAQNIADFLTANQIERPGEIGVGPPAIDYTKAPTMSEIRSRYEAGGGSTGDQQIGTVLPGQNIYTQNTVVQALRDYMARNPGASYDALQAEGQRLGVPPPQLAAALNEYRFNSLTGGSGQAYDYLMGRGAYPSSPFIPAGGSISKPYAEAVGIVPTGFYAGRATSTAPSDIYTGRPGAGSGSGSGSTTTAPSGDPNEMVTWRNSSTYETVRAPRSTYANDSNWQIINVPGGADGGLANIISASASHGGQVDRYNLGGYSDGGRLLRGPGDGVSDSIPAVIGNKQPARLADGEFVIPARIVSELGNGSTEAGARKLYAMMDRVQRARAKTTGKGRVARNTKAERYLPA